MKHILPGLKDWILFFSLANFLFLFAWQDYFRHYPAKPMHVQRRGERHRFLAGFWPEA